MKKKPAVTDSRPINSIMNLKSNDDLRGYLEDRPQLNLSLMQQKNGSTLLHFSAYKNQLSKLKIYVLHFEAFAKENLKHNRNDPSFQNQLKAWINVQNNEGMTALHYAGLHGNIEMINFLERCGANMKAQTNKKEDIIFMAIQNNHLKTLAYLLQHRDGRLPYNLNFQNIEGNTPLHVAASYGHHAIVSYLLSLNDDDLDRDAVNHEGQTPLMLAVNDGHKEIVKRMLLKGVNRHIKDRQQQKAIDIAQAIGNYDLVRILNDEFTAMEKLKIACNVKIVYQVQKPTVAYCLTFLILFHLIYLPSNVFAQVQIFDTPYVFYGIAGLYYLFVMVIFVILTTKHPKKQVHDIQQLQLPICAQCRDSVLPNEFHCFICGVCVFRYDHHCPWINNCVSAFNIGKFILFLVMLIVACLEIIFMALSLQIGGFKIIKKTSLLPLDEDIIEKIVLANCIFSTIMATVICLMTFNLLGDQLKNLFSNSTSYQRARNIKKESLLTTVHDRTSINQLQSDADVEEEQEQGGNCFGNCCEMLSQKYTTIS